MSSPIEFLPMELLELITASVSPMDVSRLSRCSKHLRQYLQPVLYKSEIHLNRAMRTACKTGNNFTIRLAVSYGASVTTVQVFQDSCTPPKIFEASTLRLAAKNGHLSTVLLLVELGASFDNMERSELDLLLGRRLLLPRNVQVLRYFLSAIKKHDLLDLFNIKITLVSLIRRGASADLVELLLRNGADPNRLAHLGQWCISPLSAAVMRNSVVLFDILVEKGADVNLDPSLIHAAAWTMATYGDTRMFQRCCDLGLNVNKLANTACGHTTPLCVYLASIKDWDGESDLRPIDGLAYLLHQRANIEGQSATTSHTYPTIWRNALEMLLNRFEPDKLLDPQYFAVIKHLVLNGASERRYLAARILCRQVQYIPLPWISPGQPKISYKRLLGWSQFVEFFLGYLHTEARNSDSLSDILNYIMRHYFSAGSFGYPMIFTFDGLMKTGTRVVDHTALHVRQSLRELCYMDPAEWRELNGTLTIVHRNSLFENICRLIENGADPQQTVNGKRAIDTLLGRPEVKSEREERKEFLLNMAGN